MRNPGGYAFISNPDTQVVNLDKLRCEEIRPGVTEYDTFSCFHCSRIIHVKPRMDPADMGGLCKICMKLICPSCVGKGCEPLEKKIERAEARFAAVQSYGI